MTIHEILLEKDVPCTMRDGVVLYADIYRPNQEGEFPILLVRHPYNKNLPMFSHRYLDTNRLVQNGYIVINQDVRGRFASGGDFYPFLHEAEDGVDTVEWAAGLPFSNGIVGMFGLSYYGFTQLMAASMCPPHLYAIAPAMTFSDWRDNTGEKTGKFLVASTETWALESVAPDELARKNPSMMGKLMAYDNDIEKWYAYRPIKEWPPLKELGAADYFFDLLEGNVSEATWEKVTMTNKYDQLDVPAYHIAGWYDNLLQTTLQNYTEMSKRHGTSKQKLIVGPWGHGVFQSVIGERNFGVYASGDWLDLTSLHIRWFDKWLKGEFSSAEEEAPVKIFVMGINEWREENEWPLARAKYTPLYLHGDGAAATRFGDGGLSFEKPDEERADTFVYDPDKPVPTNGGGTLYAGVNTMGPHDQRGIEERDDVLVYTTEPLAKPIEVTGPIKMKLWAKTDACDTDFTVKLIDVLADGTAFNLTDGIVRAMYRNGRKEANDIAGEIVEYEIDLPATSNVFLPGHSIRIELSSSNFPKFDVNLNTGKSMINSTTAQKATQTIYHTTQYPSRILLPIV